MRSAAKVVPIAGLKLDLSFGELQKDHPYHRPKGFDPLVLPWKLKTASVDEAYSAYLLHRLPSTQRGPFMDELWRVLQPGGKATIIVPYWSSARSIQDPTAEWPPLCEQSFLYFNKQFRDDNKWPSAMVCDFDFVYGYTFDPETAAKSDDTRGFWLKHYTNTIADVQVVLTKRP
jgi:hypothetical protein